MVGLKRNAISVDSLGFAGKYLRCFPFLVVVCVEVKSGRVENLFLSRLLATPFILKSGYVTFTHRGPIDDRRRLQHQLKAPGRTFIRVVFRNYAVANVIGK